MAAGATLVVSPAHATEERGRLRSCAASRRGAAPDENGTRFQGGFFNQLPTSQGCREGAVMLTRWVRLPANPSMAAQSIDHATADGTQHQLVTQQLTIAWRLAIVQRATSVRRYAGLRDPYGLQETPWGSCASCVDQDGRGAE